MITWFPRFGVRRARFAYFGHSLGSAVAARAGSGSPSGRPWCCSRLFLPPRQWPNSCIVRPIDLGWKAISRIHFDTRQAVSRLDVPVSVAHGKRDRTCALQDGGSKSTRLRNERASCSSSITLDTMTSPRWAAMNTGLAKSSVLRSRKNDQWPKKRARPCTPSSRFLRLCY